MRNNNLQERTFLSNAFLQAPVTGETPNGRVDNRVTIAIVRRRQALLGHSQTYRVRDTLSKRTRCHLDARKFNLGVSSRHVVLDRCMVLLHPVQRPGVVAGKM